MTLIDEYQYEGQQTFTKYKIFVPENVTEETQVIFYTCNIVFTDEMQQDILNNNGDAIIIVPCDSPVIVGGEDSNHLFQNEAIEVFNRIKEEYGLETTSYVQAGFSSGYGCSVRTMADYIKQNPDCGRQVLISVDGCESTFPGGFPIYGSEYDALKENNTIIISYSKESRHGADISFLRESGLPILFVVDPDVENAVGPDWHYYHNLVANNFTKKGLYEELMNFALGKSDLPEGYIYQVYNPETGEVENIDREQVAEFFGIDTYSIKINELQLLKKLKIEEIISDKQILLNYTNDIISNIKNSNFVQNGINYNMSFESTTMIPSSISEILKTFYEINSTLLLKIAREVQEFVKIGDSIERQDKELESEAIELGSVMVNESIVENNNQ